MKNVFRLLLAAALLSAVLAGCGGGGSPTDVARDFMESMVGGNSDHAYDLLSAASRDIIPYEDFEELMGEGTSQSLEGVDFELQEQTSDRATVKIAFPYGEGGEIPLVKEEGAWKVDLAGIYTQMNEANN